MLYPLLVLLVGYLSIKGYIDGDTQSVILAAGALIAGAAGIETARSKVSPV